MNVLMIAIAVLVIAALFWFFKIRKEKFVMTLYRPNYTTNIPPTTWDPADVLTAVMPQGKNKSPKLAVELGDYRRFNRI